MKLPPQVESTCSTTLNTETRSVFGACNAQSFPAGLSAAESTSGDPALKTARCNAGQNVPPLSSTLLRQMEVSRRSPGGPGVALNPRPRSSGEPSLAGSVFPPSKMTR